jgi:hypothetical protein
VKKNLVMSPRRDSTVGLNTVGRKAVLNPKLLVFNYERQSSSNKEPETTVEIHTIKLKSKQDSR